MRNFYVLYTKDVMFNVYGSYNKRSTAEGVARNLRKRGYTVTITKEVF